MDSRVAGTTNEWTAIAENVFRGQLIRVGYMLWDNFISPLYSTLMGVNSDMLDTQEELVSMAPVVKNAMSTVKKMIMEMGEQYTGRYARASRCEARMEPMERAMLSCMRRDMNVRYVEFIEGVATIEYALEEINRTGVNRRANNYRRMLNVVENWYARVNSLHAVPTSAMLTADYVEERYGVVAQRDGEIPPWVDQTVLNMIITSLLQNRKSNDIVYRQSEGGVLVECGGVSAGRIDVLGKWRPDEGVQDVLHLMSSLCVKTSGMEKPTLIYASRAGYGARFSIVWDAACEFNHVPSGWYSITYSNPNNLKGRFFPLSDSPSAENENTEGMVLL